MVEWQILRKYTETTEIRGKTRKYAERRGNEWTYAEIFFIYYLTILVNLLFDDLLLTIDIDH